eukprot:13244401-Alexandrium_andersonii.AAC.1
MPPEGAAGALGRAKRASAMTSSARATAASKSMAIHLASLSRELFMRTSQSCSWPLPVERNATTFA